ncbi:hypothetical protein [Actinocorallia populi]|uniref:hypothetical protein n=1 Tax=Actinocorallia populi TaxID=2079200 RepID=UPI0018E53EF6|nr:hypothetical protein [Actinocorallia populi]
MTTIERKTVARPRRRSAGPGPQSDTRPDRGKGGGKEPPEEPPVKAKEPKTKAKEPKVRRPRAGRRAGPAEPRASRTKERTPKTRTPEKRTLKPGRARPAAEPAERGQAQKRPRPRPQPSSGRPRAPFVLLILCLLGGALVGLLVLNTVLARDAYTLSALEDSEHRLTQQKQTLIEEIAREEAPLRLELKARNQGMVQPRELAFVDPDNGRVTGGKKRPVPSAAAAAAAATGIIGVPGAIVPGDGIPGWTGAADAARPEQPEQTRPERTP